METNKVKILTLKLRSGYQRSLPGKTKRLEVGFGLFRIIFTLLELKQKELALNATEILQLKRNCTRHFIEHGRAYIKILFMIAQQDLDRTSARAML